LPLFRSWETAQWKTIPMPLLSLRQRLSFASETGILKDLSFAPPFTMRTNRRRVDISICSRSMTTAIGGFPVPKEALDQQQVDVALGAFDKVPPRLRSEVLFHDEKAWAIGTHHPLAKQLFDHAAFRAWPRLAIGLARAADKSREPPARNDLVFRGILETDDEADSPRAAQRASTSMMVYDAETAMAVTAATDMVALVPRRYAEACASSAQIRIIDFPQDHAEMIELSMLWHSRVHDDPGSLWLRALIREAVNLSSDPLRPRGSVNRTSTSAGAAKAKKAKKVPARGGSRHANRV
jgi:DNA-binding transcriptional LysR family regulator